MKALAVLAGLFMTVLACADVEYPKRIVSLGLCTDQLLLQMVGRERIASLSYKAIDANMSYMADWVGDIPLNRASVEEIIPYQPDLVVSSAFGARDTVRLLKQLGFSVKTIPLPQSIDEIYELLRLAGQWFGTPAKAKQMIDEMQRAIVEIQKRNAGKPEKTAVVYSPNGYTIGLDTLENDVMRLAGFRNLSAEMGIQRFQKISLERLVAASPDTLLIDNHVYNRDSLAHEYLDHPVLQKMVPKQQQLFIPSRLRACGGTMTVDAINYLAGYR